MSIDPEAILWRPAHNELIVVRGLHDSRSVDWGVNVDSFSWNAGAPHGLTLVGRVVHAAFLDGLDYRLDNQRRAIEELGKHLRHHCDGSKAYLQHADASLGFDWAYCTYPHKRGEE